MLHNAVLSSATQWCESLTSIHPVILEPPSHPPSQLSLERELKPIVLITDYTLVIIPETNDNIWFRNNLKFWDAKEVDSIENEFDALIWIINLGKIPLKI